MRSCFGINLANVTAVQADTGASAGAPHKGLVEELVEKAKEYLPHQLTGVETESNTSTWGYTGSTGTGYTGSTATGYTGSTATGYAGSGTSAYDRVSFVQALLAC